MNDFEKRIKVDIGTIKKINDTESNEQAFKNKLAFAVCEAIDKVQARTKQEEIMKTEYLLNINKIINDYEELRPILTEYFENKKGSER